MAEAPGTEGETERLRRRVTELEQERRQFHGPTIGGRSWEAIDADLKNVHEKLSNRQPISARRPDTSAGPSAGTAPSRSTATRLRPLRDDVRRYSFHRAR